MPIAEQRPVDAGEFIHPRAEPHGTVNIAKNLAASQETEFVVSGNLHDSPWPNLALDVPAMMEEVGTCASTTLYFVHCLFSFPDL